MQNDEIVQLFNADDFRETGIRLMGVLAEMMTASMAGKNKALAWRDPQEAMARFQAELPRYGHDLDWWHRQIEEFVLPNTLHVHHPNNLGHQVAPPLPLAALCDLIAALTNQAMAVYETGPSATLMEKQVLQWLGTLIGWDASDGVLTSGGAQANLTALLAARQVSTEGDVWNAGLNSAQKLVILTSELAHYSVGRSAAIMGLGMQAVIKVKSDEEGRMSVDALIESVEFAREQGMRPIAVVATAGCTPTGSIDPLDEIAKMCAKHHLWMHVDGAHGASGLLTEQHRDALRGIECADSVVWDGHKLMYMPAPVSAVLFKNPRHSYQAFSQQASYLFQGADAEAEAYNMSYRTLECTKRMMGLKLWTAFSVYGVEKLGQLVDHVYAMARTFAQMLQSTSDFELLMAPQTNIVCFRYRGIETVSVERLNEAQARIRTRIVQSGDFHLTQTEVHGSIWLRTTIMNPLTAASHLQALLEAIRQEAAR
jgi:L-2,4-diaminobutyrate decarboxylase